MKKKISIILATAILVSATAAAFASERIALTPKADNPISAWALDSVEKAEENKILETGKNYIFANPITREEFCELIYNLIHNEKDVIFEDGTEVPIDDIVAIEGNQFSETENI